ncbi:MAG: flagellin, partial [Lachnospiraceae bacterium]|nr:flagellin [Lachnospiraceae bacterium]
MRIQHNITSLNVHRNLTGNNRSVARDLEKLSSGYKINRAGDDAAGLAISEKMRAQITGLEQAWQNADDGISLVQTAEGAMTEVHTMLNRMMELSVQSANGTYTEKERIMMNQEVQKLKTEITRIGNTTSFNSIHLFPDGSIFSAKEASVTTYNLTLDLKNGTVQIDRSGAASASGAGGVSRAANNLADKIAEEYFPNAV